MGNECVMNSKAANRDVCGDSPTPRQDCNDVLHISIFFDGTGNNEEKDATKKKWSNVARLHKAAQMAAQSDKSKTFYPIYLAGVGTKFNGKAADWISATSAWIEDGFPGAGAGAGGDRRMSRASDLVNESLRDALIARAKLLGGEVAKHATESSARSLSELNISLAKHRLIKMVNISIFGFSRGASLARAFSNRIAKKMEGRDGDFFYQGHPLRINFIGVFDTVASFGVPAQNARTPFTERELMVPGLVERCVHFVAGHELRFSFPVDLIRKNGTLPEGWIERVYPGVHSDVGGGYEPGEQDLDNNYARVPMRAMWRESLHCGVRLLAYDEIRTKASALFKERFECSADTETAFRAYMAALGKAEGAVEEQIKSHLKLYYSVNGTLHRRGVKNAGDRSRTANKMKYIFGSKGMAFEVKLYRSLLKAGKWLRLGEENARGFAQYLDIKDWQLAAWDAEAAPAVVDFVFRYIHDSKVDFMGNIEPFSYFRPRGVDESSVSVWTEGGNWIRSKVDGVTRSARSIADASVSAYASAIESGKEAVDTASRRVDELGSQAGKIYENGIRWAHKKMFDPHDYME